MYLCVLPDVRRSLYLSLRGKVLSERTRTFRLIAGLIAARALAASAMHGGHTDARFMHLDINSGSPTAPLSTQYTTRNEPGKNLAKLSP